jgi:hypothetical protein
MLFPNGLFQSQRRGRSREHQLERGEVKRGMYPQIIPVGDSRCVIVPIRLTLSYVSAQRIQNSSFKPLNLAVSLGMIRGREDLRDPQLSAHFQEEFRGKLRSIVA